MTIGRSMDLSGHKYGRLLVLNYYGRNTSDNRTMWWCECECGIITIVKGQQLRNGKTKSCGCIVSEMATRKVNKINKLGLHHSTHGLSGTKLYNVWKAMNQRCYNPNNSRYYTYGERGIKVCKEWLDDFMNFYNWSMENGYEEGLSIERVNVNGNYEPSNCKWIPLEDQSKNRTDTIYITHDGKSKSINKWAEETNQNVDKLKARYYRNWNNDEIIGGR